MSRLGTRLSELMEIESTFFSLLDLLYEILPIYQGTLDREKKKTDPDTHYMRQAHDMKSIDDDVGTECG